MYNELTLTSPLDNCILNAFVVTHLYKEAKLFGLASEPFNWRTGGFTINVPESTCRKMDIGVKEEILENSTLGETQWFLHVSNMTIIWIPCFTNKSKN